MYFYRFILTASRLKSGLVFSEHKEKFSEAVRSINSGIVFQRTGKTLSIDKIQERSMEVTLESRGQLENPAKSLSAITRYLTTNYPEIFNKYLYNKTLMNMKLDSQSSSPDPLEKMNNSELLKRIIDILSEPESEKKKKTIAELKDTVTKFYT